MSWLRLQTNPAYVAERSSSTVAVSGMEPVNDAAPERRTEYPPRWSRTSRWVRGRAGWRCELCGVKNGPPPKLLTVHHLDSNKWSPYVVGKKIRSLFIESSYRHAIFHNPFELNRLADATEWHSTILGLEWMPKWLLEVLYPTDNQLGRIFKPFGAFLATKAVILTAPAKPLINKA